MITKLFLDFSRLRIASEFLHKQMKKYKFIKNFCKVKEKLNWRNIWLEYYSNEE